jgi:tetratricopeptide (TPR) repeat protein
MGNRRTVAAALLTIAGLICTLDAQRLDLQRIDATRERAMVPYRAGLEYLKAEDWDKAVAEFRSAVELDPGFEMAYYGLGRAHMGLKAYGEAIGALAKCRDLYAAHAGQRFTNTQEAQRYRKDQMLELDEIIRQYQSGPQSARTSETLRQLNERKRQLQETINRGTNLTIENSVPAYVSLSLGSAYFRIGRMTDAEREYKATIAADPKTGEAHSNLAVVYLETGRYDDAEKAVKAAEKTGLKVHPGLKEDIRKRKGSGSD